jgi:hypothetical protein
LRLKTARDALRLVDKLFKLLAGADIQRPKAFEKLLEILDRTVAKHLGTTVVASAKPLRQVRHEFGQLVDEGGFGEAYRFLKARLGSGAFLAIKLRAESLQVRRRFDIGKIPSQIKQAAKRFWVIARIK